MSHIFSVKPHIYFGAEALAVLQQFKSQKVWLVTDPFMVKSGMVEQVTKHLGAGNFQVFSDIVPDPPVEVILQGIQQVNAYQPEIIIAFGGGSAIDSTKAIFYFAQQTGQLGQVQFIAIPTTSGTGSEVTSFAVITDPQKGTKYPLVADEMLPDLAILAPELVKTLPQPIIADTGMDVLTHALEALVSTKANDFSDSMAEKAIDMVFRYLPLSYLGETKTNEEAKEKMHNASCLAGLAFNNTSLGVNHSIAHVLGAKFKIPHGRANAILLPHVIAFNAAITGYNSADHSAAAEKYSEAAKKAGLGGTSVKTTVNNLINAIKKLQRQMNMAKSLKECGVTLEVFELAKHEIADLALQDGCLATNPRPVTKEDVLTILNKIYR